MNIDTDMYDDELTQNVFQTSQLSGHPFIIPLLFYHTITMASISTDVVTSSILAKCPILTGKDNYFEDFVPGEYDLSSLRAITYGGAPIYVEHLRHANISLLESFNITEADLQRTGLHPELGIVTLSQLLACWATHDLAHIEQISRSLVRHRAPTIGPWRQYYSLLAGY